jgi:S-DNA-T family DNA segregation ATPase FtsK/SpoIIIE
MHDDLVDEPGRYETSFEVVLDEEPEPTIAPVYVDQPAEPAARRPIIPESLRSREAIRAGARRAAGRAGHTTGYHAVRAPKYATLGLFWAAVGLFRLAGRQLHWWWVLEQHQLRQEAATKNDPQTWEKLHREAKATRLWRGSVLGAELAVLVVAIVLLLTVAPWWIRLPVAAVVVPVLAHVGRPVGRPIVTAAVVTPRFRKLTADIVLRAYYAAKLGDPVKPGLQIMFGGPMARDALNTGSEVVIDLPYGSTFAEVIGVKGKIASGLDVTEFQVFLTRDRTSERRHRLFVADRDPLAIAAGRTPMLDCRPRSVWGAMPFGLDERGRRVSIELMWHSILVGAQPRKGKTFAARAVALFCALDPWTKIFVVDGKQSPDWRDFELVAERVLYGVAPNRDGDPVEELIFVLEGFVRHIERVNDVLSGLPVDLCPEGKLTRELAQDPRFPDLRVWVLVMEEFQVYFETDDQDRNKLIARLLSRVLAQGPSAGVILLSASQKPAGVGAGDVARLFNRFRDNHDVRYALRCGNRLVSEAVLGGDAYSEGYDASSLPLGPEYRGVGYLYGLTDETPTVRGYLADGKDAKKILLTARRHRELAGTLSGQAAGEQAARDARDVLNDVIRVWSYVSKPGVQWPFLAEVLREQLPEKYAGTTAESLSALVRAEGVPSVNVKVDGSVVKGCKREDVEAALRRRELASR